LTLRRVVAGALTFWLATVAMVLVALNVSVAVTILLLTRLEWWSGWEIAYLAAMLAVLVWSVRAWRRQVDPRGASRLRNMLITVLFINLTDLPITIVALAF
jgi:hypothetical protein